MNKEELETIKEFAVYNEQHKENENYIEVEGEKLYNPWSCNGRSLDDVEAVTVYGFIVLLLRVLGY